jgi:hypothetical protein
MMQVLLGLIGVLVPAGVGLGIVSVWARMRFAREPGSFRCRLGRLPRRPSRRGRVIRWDRSRTRARWINDVLLIQTGLLGLRTTALHVRLPLAARIETEPVSAVKRLGTRPQALWIDRGRDDPIKVAVSEADRTRLAGPFMAAAIAGLPAGPRSERGRRA